MDEKRGVIMLTAFDLNDRRFWIEIRGQVKA